VPRRSVDRVKPPQTFGDPSGSAPFFARRGADAAALERGAQVLEDGHPGGQSVTAGGYVGRGNKFPPNVVSGV
jgi:hypothetical protein